MDGVECNVMFYVLGIIEVLGGISSAQSL